MVEGQVGDAPIELKKGIRVGVEVPDRGTYVAVIERVVGRVVEVELLDDVPEGALQPDRVVNVFVSRPAGLYCWLSQVIGQSRRSALSLAMIDPVRLEQRRRHVRMDVDIPAVVRRVRGGRRGRAQTVRIADLSIGGLKLIGAVTLATVDAVVVDVDLGEGLVSLDGRVVMSYPTSDGTRVAHVAFSTDYPWIDDRAGDSVSPGLSLSS
jgi:PilZ domain